MKRLINAIQFSEFNISFDSYKDKGLSPELLFDMQKAIQKFNSKLTRTEAEQNFYNSLLNRIDFGILVIDKNGKITWINKAALDIFQKPQPRKIEDLEKVAEHLPKTLMELVPRETKTIKIEQNNAILHLAVTVIYFTLEGKQLKLFSIKNIQTVLEESESEAWKKLIRVLTHEIMNSITPIISLSDTFAEPDEENKEMLSQAMKTIHRRSKGLVDFVQNYQKLSKIPLPEINSFSAKELMEDITRLLQADGLSFTYRINPNDLALSADRSQIEQVMINLIKNAHEASSFNMNPEVTVDIFLNEYHKAIIHVKDNGEGILPEVLDKIFVPFFTTKTKGSGIGLSICRQIINLHGGSITVQSEPGKGSCFSIYL
ncbi:MAG: PAS domain-containing protein [Bacteroidales bacterium]|nr:PAS domain-containing protein [Bacteroidales bacterium]